MPDQPPLTGLRVLELAGLAPGPFAGMLLADFGATVLRIDRAHPAAHTAKPPPPTPDFLARRKTSVAVDLKSAAGLDFIKALIPTTDIIIDPFRPGVLEKIGLSPELLLKINPRLIVARMTGFRRDGKYKDMAGHDINYIAVSGVLSMLGRAHEKPYAPGNIVGDFAGGGMPCFLGILLALLQRDRSGKGQVVEANMVDGSSYIATFLRLARSTPMWDAARGENVLDGGCPYYDTYATKDGKYMAVGALEPHFFAALLKGLEIDTTELIGRREDKSTWKHMRGLFTRRFEQKTRQEWEAVFDGTDACCTPVLDHDELEENRHDQRPLVTLTQSPGFALSGSHNISRPAVEGQGGGVEGAAWRTMGLRPGVGGEAILAQWMGWQRGQQYELRKGGLELLSNKPKAMI